MKRIILCVVAAFSFLGGALCAEECHEYKLTFIPKAVAPVEIDGKVDEKEWGKAAKISDFGGCSMYCYGADVYMPPTEGRIMWDEKYLYISCICYEDTPENMSKFKVDIADESGIVCNHDTFEFHLNGPNPGALPKTQVFLVPMSAREIMRYYDNGWGREVDADYGRNADWEKAHYIGKNFWSVEAKIAHESIGTTPKVGFRLGMNLARLRFNKNYVKASDGSPTSVRHVQVFCWANRKQSQHSTLHGRGIFVEKRPENVVDGLRLSYPDLGKQRVLVQTDNAYVVVEDGKVSELGYLEKARQLAKDSLKEYKRLYDLTNAVPEPKKGLYKSCFATAFADRAKIEEILKKYLKATSCNVDDLASLEELVSKSKLNIENAYYDALRKLMLVEGKVRYPTKLIADENAPALEKQFACTYPNPYQRVNDGVRWARPSATGKRKALVCVEFGDAYAAWELKHRLDLDIDVFVMNDTFHLKRGLFRPITEQHYYTEKEKHAMLETTLAKNNYDDYIFVGNSPSLLPLRIQCAIAERLLNGARAITINGDDWGYSLKENKDFLSTIPRPMKYQESTGVKSLDSVEKVCAFPPLRTTTVGKGAYSVWNTGKGTTYMMYTTLYPGWSFLPKDLFQDEYCYAAAAKAVAEALDLRGNVKVKKVSSRPQCTSSNAIIDVEVTGLKETPSRVALVIRNSKGDVVAGPFSTDISSNGQERPFYHATFDVGQLDMGRHYADAFIIDGEKDYDGKGFTKAKVFDWGSCLFDVEIKSSELCRCTSSCKAVLPPAKIESITPRGRIFKKYDNISATVSVSNPVEGLSLDVSLRDPRGRIIEKGVFKVDAKTGKTQVSFPMKRLVENCHFIVANLVDAKGSLVDKMEKDIYRKIGRRDDYTVFSDGFDQGGYNGLHRLATLDYYGIGCCQDGSPLRLMFGGDPVIRDRIAGGYSEMDGSMASPYFLRTMAERFTKTAAKIADKNGLFISCGDDSSVPTKFSGTTPDWAPMYFHDLGKRISAEAAATGQKEYSVIEKWCKVRGIAFRGYKFTQLVNQLRPLKGLPKLLEANLYPEDYADIAKAIRSTYTQKNGVEHFNRQNGTNISSWKELTKDVIRSIKPSPSSEFVEFLFWLKDKRYGTIEKLNAAWKSSFKDFFEITQESIVDLQHKKFYAAELDRREYMKHIAIGELSAAREAVRKVDPTIQIFMGCTGYYNLIEPCIMTLGSTCPYWMKHRETEIFRRLKKTGGVVGDTLGTYGSALQSRSQREWDVWHSVLTGANMGWFWTPCYALRGDLSVEDGYSGYTLNAYRELKRGPVSLMLRSNRENDGIRLLRSTDSSFLEGLRDDLGNVESCCKVFQIVLENAGFQYDYIFDGDIAGNALEKEKAKVLILPAAQMLSKKVCDNIRAFVKNGGTVIADFRPATVAKDGSLLQSGSLDDVFGVRREGLEAKVKSEKLNISAFGGEAFNMTVDVDTSYRANGAQAFGKTSSGTEAFFMNKYGKGHAILFNFNAVAFKFTPGTPIDESANAALRASLALGNGPERQIVAKWKDNGKRVHNTEITRFTREGQEFVGFEKKPAAGDVLPGVAELRFLKKAWTYDIRTGKAFGFVDKVDMTITGFDTKFYSRLPYEVKGMNVSAPAEIKRGDTLHIEAELVTSAAKKSSISTHVFRVDLVPPGGYTPERLPPIPYRVVDAKNGKMSLDIAIAWNESVDSFTLEVTDVATGIKSSQELKIR